VLSLPGTGFGHKVSNGGPSVAARTAAYDEVVVCHAPLSQEAARAARARHPHLRPSTGEARYRVAATDPVSGKRIFVKCRTEDAARAKARELEGLIAQAAPIRDPHDAGPRTVERLADQYIDDHLSGLSVRFREKQTYLLRRWVLPPPRRPFPSPPGPPPTPRR
jgi:hypothetical protein